MSRKRMNLTERAAEWSASHRKTAIWGWLATVFTLMFLISGMGLVEQKQISAVDNFSGESQQAERALTDAGLRPNEEEAMIHSDSLRASDPGFQRIVDQAAAKLAATEHVENVTTPADGGGAVSEDGHTVLVDFEIDHGYFERVVWPAVAHRFPPLEAAKCHRTWAGLYEECELDANPIIGRWNTGRANLYTVAGFSGHGMMHAPAAGRAIAELIVTGSFQTIDLRRFGYERVEAGEPYREVGIV